VYGALLRCAAMHAQAPKNKGPALQNHESSIAFQFVDFLCPCPTSRITLMTPAMCRPYGSWAEAAAYQSGSDRRSSLKANDDLKFIV
jgi:hypothetical protein